MLERAMNNIWQNLPDVIIDKILTYGDPEVTEKLSNVMKQITYYKSEFDYHRTNHYRPFCRWYDISETDYYKYALREEYLKKHVNKYYGDLCSHYCGGNPQPHFTSVRYMNTIVDVPTRNYTSNQQSGSGD